MTTSKKVIATNSGAFNKQINDYILAAIDGEGYGKSFDNDAEKLKFLADTYRSEYGYAQNVKRYGNDLDCFANWLMGLPSSFNVDYENHRIIELAKQWGSLQQDATDRQENRVLDNWFSLVAFKTFTLMRNHGVTIQQTVK